MVFLIREESFRYFLHTEKKITHVDTSANLLRNNSTVIDSEI